MKEQQAVEKLNMLQEENAGLDSNILVALEDAIRALRGEPVDDAEGVPAPLSLPYDWATVQSCRSILNGMGVGVVMWSVDDVIDLAPNLTREEAWQVIKEAVDDHDAEYGMTWETLRSIVGTQFGVEHLVYDAQEFNIEDADGGCHKIIADSLEQAIDIARERGIDFCTQEGAEDEGDE